MKNADIQKYTPGQNTLEPRSYTLYLLREGRRLGILGQKAVDDFQDQLIPLLAELILKYTTGESSSVTVEAAQRLLGSFLYSTDAYLKSFRYKETAIYCLSNSCAAEIYEKGQALIRACQEQTLLLYEDVRDHKLDIPIKAYHCTIDEDLPDFLNKYDLLFNAQETMATMDYPLLFDDMRLQGIFYIEQYLKKLTMETDFCHLFSPADINQLLINYGRVYRIDISESLINAFEIILTNALFSFMAGNRPGELSISNAQLNMLKNHFAGLDSEKYPSVISRTVNELLEILGAANPDFINYIEGFIPLFMPRFINALENGCLANVIVASLPRQETLRVAFNDGQQLSDETFRDLADRIRECMDPSAKVNLIQNNINSLADFIDVLEADCLFGEDYVFLFNSLGDIELSILAGIAFAEQLHGNPSNMELQNIAEQDLDVLWHLELALYFRSLAPQRLQFIELRLKDPPLML